MSVISNREKLDQHLISFQVSSSLFIIAVLFLATVAAIPTQGAEVQTITAVESANVVELDKLNVLERTALFTYEFIQSLFDSAGSGVAQMVTNEVMSSTTEAVENLPPAQSSYTITGVTDTTQTVVDDSNTITVSGITREELEARLSRLPTRVVSPTYTTSVGGVTNEYLEERLRWAMAGVHDNRRFPRVTRPGGDDTQVQFNNDGAFGGDAGFTYNSTTGTLAVPNMSFGNATATNFTVTGTYFGPAAIVSGSTFINTTSTNATATNLFASNGVFTNTTTTNATATNSFATNLVATNATTANLIFTNATGTNATTTNFFSTLGHLVTGVIDNLTSTIATIANLTTTNSTSTNSTTTNLFATNFNGTNGTTTNASSTNLFATNFNAGNATTTNLAVTGVFSVPSASLTDATITNATATNLFASNGVFTNTTTTNATATNSFATNLVATNATTANLIFTNATGTNATTTNFFSTLLAATTAVFTNLVAGNSTTTNATTTNLSTAALAVTGTGTTTFAGPITSAVGDFIIAGGTSADSVLLVPYGGQVGIGSTGATAKLSVAQGTLTSAENALHLTGTWNSGGTTFEGILANFTDTTSAVGSKLLTLQKNGIPQFTVDKNGNVVINGTLGVVGTTTLNQPLDANSNKLLNVATPTSGNDGVNKSYVDSLVLGLSWQAPATSLATTSAPGAPAVGDRYVLLPGQSGFGACVDDDIAEWDGIAWVCNTSLTGYTVYVDSFINEQYNFNGTTWNSIGSTIAHNSTSGIQGGAPAEYYHLDLTDYNALTSVNAQLTALQITGSPSFVNLTSTGVINASAGSAALPSYTFGGDNDTGMYNAGVNSIGFSTAGVQRMVIDAAGNTTIANLTLTSALPVASGGTGATTLNNLITLGTHTTGNYLADATGNAQITITGTGAETATAAISITADSIGDAQLAFDTGQALTTTSNPTFVTLNTGNGANELFPMDQAVLTTSAPTFVTLNTGNGANELFAMNQDVLTTSNPTFNTLTLSGGPLGATSGGTGQTTYVTGDTLYASAANTLSKLGIGAFGSVLQVSGGVPTWVATSTLGLSAGFFAQNGNSYGAVATLGTNDAFDLAFETSGSEKIRITSGGDLGIGTSTWSGIDDLMLAAPFARLTQYGTTANQAWNSRVSAAGSYIIQDESASVDHLTIRTGGDIGIGTSTWSGIDDLMLAAPFARLTQYGTTANQAWNSRVSAAGSYIIQDESASVDHLTIRTGGDIGIGTSTWSGIDDLMLAAPFARLTQYGTTANQAWNSRVSAAGSYIIQDESASVDHLTIRTGGDIGIGTSTWSGIDDLVLATPLARFTQYGSTGNRAWNSRVSGAGTYIIQDATASVDYFAILQGGNVGIGTTTPGTKLSVEGVANFSAATSSFYTTGGINLAAGCFAIGGVCVGGGGSSQWTTAGADIHYMAGNVGIGDTTPASALTVGAGDLFQVNSAGAIAGATGMTSSGVITFSGLTASRAVCTNGGSALITTCASADLSNSLTDETGSGSAVFATSPTLTTPNLGTPSAATLTNATGLPLTTGVTGVLGATNGGTAQSAYATGDTLYASAINTLSKLSIGPLGSVLSSVAGVPSWVATSTLGLGSGAAGWVLGGNSPAGAAILGTNDNSAMTIQTGTGALAIGTDAAAKTITLGNTTGGTAVNINTGTGGSTFTTTNGTFSLNTGTGAINIGTDASAKVLTIGNTTGATAVNVNTGTGNFALNTNQLFANRATGNVSIGTLTATRRLTVEETVAAPQVLINYDAARFATLQVDSVGDLFVEAQGQDVFAGDDNFWACAGGSCPAGTPPGTGNIIAETSIGVASSTPFAKLSIGSNGAIVTTEKPLVEAATITVDWRDGNQQQVVLTADRQIDLTGYIAGQTLRIVLCQDGAGSHLITWGTAISWAGGSAPTLTTTAGKCDVMSFVATNGTGALTVFGASTLNF